MDKEKKIIVGISVGDLNGIGLEVVLKTFEDKRMLDFCTPVIFGSSKVVSHHNKFVKSELQPHSISHIGKINPNKMNVLNVWEEEVAMNLGTPTEESGSYALQSLVSATDALRDGNIDLLITAPISKDNIQSETFKFDDFDDRRTSFRSGNWARSGFKSSRDHHQRIDS
jgi:4-hydroxy-L-threonine phosphate dehydrogenase PdxA